MNDDLLGDPLGVVWGSHMSVGVGQLDADHEQIIAVLNELVAAIDRHDAAIDALFKQLMGVVEGHFAREERVLASCRFDGLEYHAREHGKIRDRLLEIQAHQLHATDQAIRTEVREFLTNWLYGHVLVDDFAYRESLHDRDDQITQALAP